jgi:L-ascorbate metabolism protein UlaG (beta-lactamase superfamily)
MVEAARILGVSRVVPAHIDSWSHFTETPEDVRAAFDKAGVAALLQP